AVLEQLVQIGFGEFIFIAALAVLVASISAIITLKLAKKSVSLIEKIDYGKISKAVIIFIVIMTIVFSGAYGLLLLVTCTALGIFANLSGIRRSVLMGVLILPTIIFYLPF
ncbi:MAG: tripartite tricarboxylate transporter permease, partial [Candidatus Aenigmarchaeota archaeon]|nr:tripartite tricarboxylate transporter permease [Candidatus Aenigmarchaeota archaeon]